MHNTYVYIIITININDYRPCFTPYYLWHVFFAFVAPDSACWRYWDHSNLINLSNNLIIFIIFLYLSFLLHFYLYLLLLIESFHKTVTKYFFLSTNLQYYCIKALETILIVKKDREILDCITRTMLPVIETLLYKNNVTL